MGIFYLSQTTSMYTMLQKRKARVGGKKRQNAQIIIYPKTGQSVGRTTSKNKEKSRSQTGGFFNRYDFAYAGREDTVNQVGKVNPKIISQTTGEINKIAQQRIDQIIRSGGAEIERIVPKVIKRSIEEVYKTLFRMLGNFGKTQFRKIKRKLSK